MIDVATCKEILSTAVKPEMDVFMRHGGQICTINNKKISIFSATGISLSILNLPCVAFPFLTPLFSYFLYFLIFSFLFFFIFLFTFCVLIFFSFSFAFLFLSLLDLKKPVQTKKLKGIKGNVSWIVSWHGLFLLVSRIRNQNRLLFLNQQFEILDPILEYPDALIHLCLNSGCRQMVLTYWRFGKPLTIELVDFVPRNARFCLINLDFPRSRFVFRS